MWKYKHFISMSKSAWCDLNSEREDFNLHDMCPKPKCNCQIQITFTPKQIQLECSGSRSKLNKFFERSRASLNKFLKPAPNTASPSVGIAVIAETKNPKIGETTSNILRSISGETILRLKDERGNRLRSKVM